MATSQKSTGQGVSRRGFIAAFGAATAAAALPAGAAAGPAAPARWADAKGLIPALRAAYAAELERFAERLRPRFESGELRGFTDDDMEREFGDRSWVAPLWKLEKLCAAHFGLEVATTEVDDCSTTYEGDAEAAHLVLLASPSRAETADCYYHECHHASAAVTADVLRIARERGWYRPTQDEAVEFGRNLVVG
jgi:hypothetical protein